MSEQWSLPTMNPTFHISNRSVVQFAGRVLSDANSQHSTTPGAFERYRRGLIAAEAE
ncbi:MAG: hypothetical protein ABSA48_06755 [Terracidiphilus sp.]